MYIGSGLLYKQTTMFLFGRFGSFKSWLAIDLAGRVSNGLPWLGFDTVRAKVCVVNIEIPKFLYRSRVQKYVNGNGIPCNSDILWITEHHFKLDETRTINDLKVMLKTHKPDVLVIDPWYKTISGDISKSTEIQSILDRLDDLMANFGLSVVLVGHTRKPKDDIVQDWGLELMGSSHVQNWVDTSIAVEPTSTKSLRLHFTKTRNATEDLTDMEIAIDRKTMRFLW